jgi:hypothetical protein
MDRSHFLHFAWGERGSSANGKDPRCFHTSEIDPVAILIQQQFVIGFAFENVATKILRGKWEFLAGNSDRLIRSHEMRDCQFRPRSGGGRQTVCAPKVIA